jgi:hypothetical protein
MPQLVAVLILDTSAITTHVINAIQLCPGLTNAVGVKVHLARLAHDHLGSVISLVAEAEDLVRLVGQRVGIKDNDIGKIMYTLNRLDKRVMPQFRGWVGFPARA